jgi:hydroxymethylpyrimidine/phosphomethylpyrimidine kinase
LTVVCTVGTTHPLAFAGLGFALLALAADGVRPVCVVAGVSAQSADRVLARTALDPATIAAQFASLREAGVGAFHVGALVSADAVRAVAAGMASYPGVPVVLDPVLAASGGDALADDATRRALRDALLPLATVVTPNLGEAGALLEREVGDVAAMEDAGRALVALGARAALVKGGHLVGDPVDVLVERHGDGDGDGDGGGDAREGGAGEGVRVRRLVSDRVAGELRGTGDLLAVTIAAGLAGGVPVGEAVESARERVREAIVRGVAFAGTRVATLR